MAATVVYLPESCVRVLTVPACLPTCLPVLRDACLVSTFYVRVLSVSQSIPASASGSVAAQQENKGQRTSRTGTTTTTAAAATNWQQKQQKQQKPKKAER